MAEPSPIAALCARVDAPTMVRHLEEFARRVKLSGTPEERESFGYLQRTLESYGYRTELLLHDAYISLPGRARLEVGAGGDAPDCITHSFSRPSPPEGVRGALVPVGVGTADDFAGIDVRGRIVVVDGIASPGVALRASQAGAAGQVHVSPHEHLHEMCVSPVWGSPSPDRSGELPRTVVLSIRKAAGDALKVRLAAGEPLEAVLHAEVDTSWRKTPILAAELPGPASGPGEGSDGEPFVMLSGHHDTWYFGVMDNGGANATMLDAARLLAAERPAWRRGLRILFWSGHSHGRYSGSAWYADAYWDELARRCVAHVNVDSTGARGNTVLTDAISSAELTDLARDAVREQGGQEVTGHRMSRAGDQSFWGIGVPSLFMAMGEQPAGAENPMATVIIGGRGASGRRGAGLGWWWHTPDDTLDKMDPELLVRDTRIYVHALWRLLTDPVLPLRYGRQTEALSQVLNGLAGQLGARLNLAPLTARVQRLTQLVAELDAGAQGDGAAARTNRTLMALSRALVPLDYTTGDRFGHDPALPQAPYPVLDPIRRLAAAPAGSDAAQFAAVDARRAANRVAHALDQALAALGTAA